MAAVSGTLTGQAATLYVAAWARSAEPGRNGLNAHKLTIDALRANKAALTRLRLATMKATVHTRVSAPVRWLYVSPSRTRKPRQRHRVTKQSDPPRLAGAA